MPRLLPLSLSLHSCTGQAENASVSHPTHNRAHGDNCGVHNTQKPLDAIGKSAYRNRLLSSGSDQSALPIRITSAAIPRVISRLPPVISHHGAAGKKTSCVSGERLSADRWRAQRDSVTRNIIAPQHESLHKLKLLIPISPKERMAIP